MPRLAVLTLAFNPSNLSSSQTILLVFGLMIAMFVVSGGVFGLNALIWKRDKGRTVRWLELQGCRVEKIEGVFYPPKSFRLALLKYSSFEVRFVDSAGARHHSTVAVPTWSAPELIEDDIVS